MVYKLDKDGENWSKINEFEGTFIEALEYVKKHFTGLYIKLSKILSYIS